MSRKVMGNAGGLFHGLEVGSILEFHVVRGDGGTRQVKGVYEGHLPQ